MLTFRKKRKSFQTEGDEVSWPDRAEQVDFPAEPTLVQEFVLAAQDYWVLVLTTGLLVFFFSSYFLVRNREDSEEAKMIIANRQKNPQYGKGEVRIPSEDKQLVMREELRRVSATIYTGLEVLKIQVQVPAVGEKGHRRLPDTFYNSVHFGVSAWGPFGPEFSGQSTSAMHQKLREAISRMTPKPTMVYKSKFSSEDFYEEGFTVQFSFDDLRKQGIFIPRVKRKEDEKEVLPWKHALDGILKIARGVGKPYVIQWYPNQWGQASSEHVNIIQEVIPSRAGLQKLKTSSVAWKG